MSYESSSPPYHTPKHYCRKLGFEGNMKRNSFVHCMLSMRTRNPLPSSTSASTQFCQLAYKKPKNCYPLLKHFSAFPLGKSLQSPFWLCKLTSKWCKEKNKTVSRKWWVPAFKLIPKIPLHYMAYVMVYPNFNRASPVLVKAVRFIWVHLQSRPSAQVLQMVRETGPLILCKKLEQLLNLTQCNWKTISSLHKAT